MSDHDNPFSNSPTPPASLDDLLAAIKNEKGEQKYASQEDALKALASSQEFITQLLAEKKQQAEEIAKSREYASRVDSIEEVMKKLTAQSDAPKPSDPPPAGLTQEAVAELVKKTLEQSKAQDQASKNFNDVQNSLKTKFGDKVREVVAAKAAELGTTPDKLGELATTSPAMVLALFNSPKSAPSPTPAGSYKLPSAPKPNLVPAPAKSVLLGGTDRAQKEHMLEHKKAIYEKLGVTT